MHNAMRYFSVKVLMEDREAVDKVGVSLIALIPHDVLPVGIFWINEFVEVLPNKRVMGAMTSVLFRIPIIRHVYSWLGATTADRKNCLSLFASGHSVTLNPGGVAEVGYLGDRSERVLFLKSRLSYTKLGV